MATGIIPWPKKEYPVFETDIGIANFKIDIANFEISKLQELIATLSRVAEVLGRDYCYLRQHKFCFLGCPGMICCDTEGLHILENLKERTGGE